MSFSYIGDSKSNQLSGGASPSAAITAAMSLSNPKSQGSHEWLVGTRKQQRTDSTWTKELQLRHFFLRRAVVAAAVWPWGGV
jgi:hypothetical protein